MNSEGLTITPQEYQVHRQRNVELPLSIEASGTESDLLWQAFLVAKLPTQSHNHLLNTAEILVTSGVRIGSLFVPRSMGPT